MKDHHILVVEDDLEIRESLCELLGDEGYVAVGAENGRDALERLRSGPQPCLILLDLMMPVMDGWTFRAAQLCDVAHCKIPVVVISAAGSERTSTIEAQVILPKPLDVDRVLEAVQRWC